MIEVAGAGHFELIDPRSSAWPVVKEAVLELVKGNAMTHKFQSWDSVPLEP
ncbi:hypothetical protein [Tunturiibacter gelidiferens]|uniref:hypothetical protein n=1 Tax=Tunturiibacter gelidiferens TaxID=3069689 RepID=UPI003D9AF768